MKLHTVKVPHKKHTSGLPAMTMPPPKEVQIPLSMHIGAPAAPVVKAGDTVLVGDVIGESSGFVSAPVHASISGRVKSVLPMRLSNGVSVPAVTVVSDGEMRISPSVVPPTVNDYESFVQAVRASGAVGLGGAGFPTAVKLSPKDLSSIDTLVVNGAECEPYITSDTRTMLDRAEEVAEGIALVRRYLGIPRAVIGIEKNKPECREALAPHLSPEDETVMLPSLYPQGGEKVLVYHLLGRTIPEGKLPMDAGVIVMNCTTLAFIASYLRTGLPLVSKCVTVDGDAIAEPKNVIVPIGTPIAELITFAGGYREEPKKLLYGGPMMGLTVAEDTAPVLKNTNAVIALTERAAQPILPSPCIRCGSCAAHCPMNLVPPMIAKGYRLRDAAMLSLAKANLCMECGCCSFSCPAHRHIVETNRLAKRFLAEEMRKENKR